MVDVPKVSPVLYTPCYYTIPKLRKKSQMLPKNVKLHEGGSFFFFFGVCESVPPWRTAMQPPRRWRTRRLMRANRKVCSTAGCRASTELEWLTRIAMLRKQWLSDLWCVSTQVVTSLGNRKSMWDSYPHERFFVKRY